jgi:NhaP-type Na+/H+ and K+/H+ antiporter
MARITKNKAAEILGLSRQTISNYIEQGLIGSCVGEHGILYVNSEDVEKYAEKYKMLAANEKMIDDKLKEVEAHKRAINVELTELRNRATANGKLAANAVGMLFGSDGIGVQFSSFKQAQFIGMTALSVILFSGGMDTKIEEVRPVMFEGITLSTLGVLLTTIITGAFVYGMELLFPHAISLSLAGCFLLAAVMSSTDSASVFSILRAKNLNLTQNMRPLLEFESGSNDPMAYMLTIFFIEIITLSGVSVGVMLWTFVLQLVLGLVIGYFMGRLVVFVINNINLDYSSLYSILLLAFTYFIIKMRPSFSRIR